MSRAGAKSDQGDDYQRFVALHWIIRLIGDEKIEFVQAQSTGLPGVDEKITVDDVVVCYANGWRRHIQAKKNQPRNRNWAITDQALREELPKILAQLESSLQTIVELYSRTPFGDLQSLVEASREHPDFSAFKRETGKGLQDTLAKLAAQWDRSEACTLELLRRLEIGPHHSFDDWDRINREELKRLVSHADLALPLLVEFLNTHQSKLRSTSFVITRDNVLSLLRKNGCVRAPLWQEAEILEQFRMTSAIGRNDWQRTVGGRAIKRIEFDQLVKFVESGVDTVLVADRPGSGKTCLLLDLADHIEADSRYGLLFIKGDRFTRISSEGEGKTAGLPEDIPGLCGRLSETRRVVAILDSLDVLSMNREHGALGMFLRLIDRLQRMRGVTVVVACRSFDLKYDPLLRDRKWQHTISLADFDYEIVVVPLLKEWHVREDEVDDTLRLLLRLPQNLRLFEIVASHGGPYNIRSVHELHEAYLEEAVVKDSLLGDSAMMVLHSLADFILRKREQWVTSTIFPINEDVLRALVSRGVLHQDAQGKIGFGHQTLLDNLAAKSSLARGENLAAFIKAHPPFPFLRPAVRSFAFHLRAHVPKFFRRQVWSALTDTAVAYHFKRLLTESLVEIIPEDSDWWLLGRLFRQEPELFRRFFWRLDGVIWFRWLVECWLPNLGSVSTDREWYALFVARLDHWQNSFPDEVLALWQRAFSEEWDEKDNLVRRISFSLHRFQHWHANGIASLFKTLLSESETDKSFLGKAISQYVAATDRGDDLLWWFIAKDVSDEDVKRWDIGKKLHCDPHDFHDKHFFETRLLASEQLLELVIGSVQEWTSATANEYPVDNRRLRSDFLHSTTWSQRHERHDIRHADSLTILLRIVEQALKHHARDNDAWWLAHEPQLRKSCEVALLYLLLLAYKENPEPNVVGIVALLSDKELLRYGHLENELGELIGAAFHLIPLRDQEAIQRAILSLYDDEEWGEEGMPLWVRQDMYDYLVWIPVIFRLPQAQSVIAQLQPWFGAPRSSPRIHSWGGMVGSPVSLERLLQMDDARLFHLLSYYGDYDADRSSHPGDHNIGGRRMVEGVLSEAATYDPMRYLVILPELDLHGLSSSYSVSILKGVANHLRYRFGRLRPAKEGWKPIEPPPAGPPLAQTLLAISEKFDAVWQDGYAISHIVQACSEVVEDFELADRLVFLLFRLLRHPDPEETRQRLFSKDKKGITSSDLRHDAINCVRGVGAGAAMTLCTRFLEEGMEPPELLFPLLRHFAQDQVLAVRAALLHDLPLLTYKRHAWGWQLFNDIFQDSQTLLWPLVERHLYYQYREHFDKVAPCLDRIRKEAPNEAGSTLGRITALASLSGHVTQDSLFEQLEKMDNSKAWKGVAEVFAANCDQHEGHCMQGLFRMLARDEVDNKTLGAVGHVFSSEKNWRLLNSHFALRFIGAMRFDGHVYVHSELNDWIAYLAGKDSIAALDVCECLMEKLEITGAAADNLWHTESLVAALANILREADETDDEEMIRRAVRLQDKFLRMDMRGMDEFFEQAVKL